jgi:hypothetical protein
MPHRNTRQFSQAKRSVNDFSALTPVNTSAIKGVPLLPANLLNLRAALSVSLFTLTTNDGLFFGANA